MLAVLNDFSGQSLAVAQNQRRSVLEDTRGTASPLFQGGGCSHTIFLLKLTIWNLSRSRISHRE